jgi:hypothetical protein
MHPCPTLTVLAAGQVAELPLPFPGRLPFWASPHSLACSPMHQAVSINYGLVIRFRLLPTPSLDDAVAFRYGQPVLCPAGTLTPLLVRTLRRTRAGSPSRPSWAGSSEICPYRGLRIAQTYFKFLAQVTELQVFVSASESSPDIGLQSARQRH